jgi:hypothetical protein
MKPMGVIDKYRFESRGGGGCSNSDYHLHRTTCCGGFCVEDDELSDLYLDPSDLSKRVSLLRGSADDSPFPCPLCGAGAWDLVEEEELSAVPASWRWACCAR